MEEEGMMEGTMVRAAIAAIACVALAGCFRAYDGHCYDGSRNEGESGVDCGGGCRPCGQGSESCEADFDCDDGTCSEGTCVLSACANGIRDAVETDVDCGGGTCRKCSGARQCMVASDCFSGKCVAGANVCSAVTVSFASPVFYEAGYKTYVMLSGDLDKDGDVDLVAVNEQQSTLSVYRNLGTGVFERLPGPEPTGFPTGDYPTGARIADLNRDGIPDVVTADYHGNSVTVLLGWGVGQAYTLLARSTYATLSGAETSNLEVGDVNGDGIQDVIATNPQMSSMSLFIGRANGTLNPAIDMPMGMGMAEPYSVAIGDFDLNGTNDAAIADNRSQTIYVKLGNGDGTFELGPSQPDIGGIMSFIMLTHDMDLDGILDLVVTNRSSDDVSVLRGRGDGTFRAAVVSSTSPGLGPYALAIADFNLDGVPDVVTANFMSSNGTVLLGIGNGAFEAAIDAGNTGDQAYGVTAGDFNGDAMIDFAIANAASNNVAVKLSTAR